MRNRRRSLFFGATGLSGGRAFDADVLSWEAAVISNGGTVSLARRIIIDQFVFSEKAAGLWGITDDYWGFWAENSIQALTSLKQKRLATAINSPVFTADRDFAFDGASNYLDTGFIASISAIALTVSSGHVEVYERTNASGNTYAGGALVNASIRIDIRPRVTGSLIGSVSTSAATYTLLAANSQGLSQLGRNGSLVTDVYGVKNGINLVRAADPTAVAASLPNHEMYYGASNNNGVVAGFRACSIGYASMGAALSVSQCLARYNNVQTWATAVGAQV